MISARLRSALRVGDTVARMGGDEFAVLLEDVARRDRGVADRRSAAGAISAPLMLEDRQVAIRCSIGVAVAQPSGDTHAATTVGELLRDADVAMYQAKASGGNTYRHFKPEMHETVVKQLELRADLKAAIASGAS